MTTPGQNNTSVAILGPGAVGGFLASVFWRAGIETRCIATEESSADINKKGIHVKSVMLGDFLAKPLATPRLNKTPDILLVTTKATGLTQAMERVDPQLLKNTLVLPLLNGLEHIQILRKRFGDCVVAGSISIEVSKDREGIIIHSSPFARITIGSDTLALKVRLPWLASLISGVGIQCKILDSEADVLWGKLVRLNALACTTAATGKSIGFVRSDPHWRKKLEDCVREGVAVAREEGVTIDVREVMKQLDEMPPSLSTSLQRDVWAGAASEVEAIPGAVIRAGNKHDLYCPCIKELMETIPSISEKNQIVPAAGKEKPPGKS